MRFLILLALTFAPHCLAEYPATRVDPVTDSVHGQQVVDNYRWLEALEDESDAVRQWTTAQNDFTRGILDQLPGRAALEARLAQLMTIDRIGAPQMRGNLYFNEERRGDQNQSVLFVREGFDGTPRVLLDPNALDSQGLVSLDWWSPSRDGALLGFGLSRGGDEMSVLHILEVASGRWLADEIPGKTGIAGWMPDGSGFLYSRLENTDDPYSRAVRFHTIGSHHRQDPILMVQKEPARIPGVMMSEDGRWIIATIWNGWSRNDLYAVDADAWRRTGTFEMKPIAVDINARFEPHAIRGDTLYMVATLDAPNSQAFAVDLNNPARESWRLLIPQRADAVLEGLSEARGILVASYSKDATSRFEKFDLEGQSLGPIELPGLGSARIITQDDRSEAFLGFTSFNEPSSIYRIDLRSGARGLWARPSVPVDPTMIEVKQEWFTSRDGTKVPMFIVHRKGLKLDGNNPALLYGYGGFNASMTPSFNPHVFPWLEAGGVYAVANLRGGGEYGEAWHESGKLGKKQNVFDDLYAAAEHLIRGGYTNASRLAVQGGSNGGLLTGVAATQRPDLFAAVVSQVPLLDMLRYHQFLMAKFWVPEYGSADNPEQYEWLRAYSPYHNIKPGQKYPAIMFTAGENDNRVHPLHARKMVAALQALAANDETQDPILLWVDRDGGHGQGKPLSRRIRDVSDIWSFIMWQTGVSMQ